MAAKYLHALLAIEKQAKSTAERVLTDAYQTLKKHDLFNGFTKTFKPLDENGEQRPDERKNVQKSVEALIKDVTNSQISLFDTVAAKNATNQHAKASVTVGGQVLLSDVPVETLLFLEKRLTEYKAFVSEIPVLDPAFNWELDPNTGNYKTSETKTASKTKKKDFKVVVPATDKHPAQIAQTEDDVLVGYYTSTSFSSAIPATKKKMYQERVDALLAAVKVAREEANRVEVVELKVGEKVTNYLFGP